MANSELYEKGIALRTELFGEAFTEKMNASTYGDPVMQKFRDLAAETVFGALWTRPGLDLKTRALICVITDATMGRDPELDLRLLPWDCLASAAWAEMLTGIGVLMVLSQLRPQLQLSLLLHKGSRICTV